MKDESTVYEFEEEFRDTISTVDEQGKRVWVYPKKPRGYYHNLRIFVTIFLLAIFFAGPFITIGGQPLLLLDFLERRFVVFGQAFWPQDFILLALALITFFVFVILFTVVFGRLWCGWACPQTLFMEMVFRKIEYWIEGDANAQRRLNQAPWTTEKVLKKSSKQLIFIGLSIVISHTALAYLIGIDEVKLVVTDSPLNHVGGFIGIVVFTGIFYWVFAWFREQACTVVCPYGRLQSVLLGEDSIVVAYDWLRGEPRGKLRRGIVDQSKGDCIDCKLCVHVCPTGIDIRNGTQLECVNCTACIDVCDEVMVKIRKPKGLIRYASYNSIKEGLTKLFSGRVISSTVVLGVLFVLLGFMVWTRSDIETTILKVPNTLYQKGEDGTISNLYNIEFVNKTFDEKHLEVRIESPEGAALDHVGGQEVVVPAGELIKGVYFVKIPASKIISAKTDIRIGIYENGALIETVKAKFIGPVYQNNN